MLKVQIGKLEVECRTPQDVMELIAKANGWKREGWKFEQEPEMLMNSGDIGPLPEVNPRDTIVNAARRKIDDFLSEWCKEFGLTRAEYLMLITQSAFDDLRFAVNQERRPLEK